MKAVGIIAEYNPFHSGHQWQLNTAKSLSGCPAAVIVMSGQFVQRGEPALFDKWLRAEMAVRSGADLVIELPAVFALRSAQYFAAGGVRLLQALGIISHLSFGVEDNNLAALKKLADLADTANTGSLVRQKLKSGLSYPAALGQVLLTQSQAEPATIAFTPNNILAIEYLRALNRYADAILPCPVKRQHAGYHEVDISAPFASATAIRKSVLENGCVQPTAAAVIPPASKTIIEKALHSGRGPVIAGAFETALLARLRTMPLSAIAELPDVTEGLQHRIADTALTATGWDELLSAIKCKRYTHTRLQRILLHALLGTTKAAIEEFDHAGPLYARVLAFSEQGKELLRQASQQSTIPLITKTTHFLNSRQRYMAPLTPLQTMLAVDSTASDIYSLGFANPALRYGGWDFRQSPVYLTTRPPATV